VFHSLSHFSALHDGRRKADLSRSGTHQVYAVWCAVLLVRADVSTRQVGLTRAGERSKAGAGQWVLQYMLTLASAHSAVQVVQLSIYYLPARRFDGRPLNGQLAFSLHVRRPYSG
jgi:hypothetical protein